MKKLKQLTGGVLLPRSRFSRSVNPWRREFPPTTITPPYKLWNRKERVYNVLLQLSACPMAQKNLFLISIMITITNPFQVLHLGMSPKHPSLSMYPGISLKHSSLTMYPGISLKLPSLTLYHGISLKLPSLTLYHGDGISPKPTIQTQKQKGEGL